MCHGLTPGDKMKMDVHVAAKLILMSNCGEMEIFLQSYFKGKKRCLERSIAGVILKTESHVL